MPKRRGSVSRPERAPAGRGKRPSPTFTFTLYTKQRCELCERARMLLEILGAGREFQVKEVDIEAAGEEVARRYEQRVPVVRSSKGQELDLWIDPAELERLVRSVVG